MAYGMTDDYIEARDRAIAAEEKIERMKNEWTYKDIPIHKFKVVTEPNLVTGEIKQITEIAGKITEEIIQTKSEQIRNALIDLGWTPPPE